MDQVDQQVSQVYLDLPVNVVLREPKENLVKLVSKVQKEIQEETVKKVNLDFQE